MIDLTHFEEVDFEEMDRLPEANEIGSGRAAKHSSFTAAAALTESRPLQIDTVPVVVRHYSEQAHRTTVGAPFQPTYKGGNDTSNLSAVDDDGFPYDLKRPDYLDRALEARYLAPAA